MKKRLFSALIFLPPVFYAVTVGGWLFVTLIALVTMIAFYEFYKTFDILNPKIFVFNILEVLIVYIFTMIPSVNLGDATALILIFILFFVAVMAVFVLEYPKVDLKNLSMVFLGQFYILLPLNLYASNIDFSGSAYLRWLVLAFAFGADTMAMFSGMLFGKKKLIPKVSPAKTVAGCIGSIIGTGVLIPVFTYVFTLLGGEVLNNIIFSKLEFNFKTIFVLFLIGTVGSLFSQLGDLVGSAFKRQAGIKDFGNIIPGHGGILDRLDSIIFTSIYVWFLMILFYNGLLHYLIYLP